MEYSTPWDTIVQELEETVEVLGCQLADAQGALRHYQARSAAMLQKRKTDEQWSQRLVAAEARAPQDPKGLGG